MQFVYHIELPPRELMGPEGGEEDSDRDSGNEEEAVEAAAGGAAAPAVAEVGGGGEAAAAVGAEGGAVIEADVNHAILDHDQGPLCLRFWLGNSI